MSTTSSWMGSFSATAPRSFSRQPEPSSASETCAFQDSMWCTRMLRLVALSSTTSTRRPARSVSASGSLFATSSRLARSTGTRNQKREPRSASLSKPISPAIRSTSCLEIARPRPVPPKRLAMEPSAWVNDWKISLFFSAGTPMPESVTESWSQVVPSALSWPEGACVVVTRTITSPRSVNFTAFPARFTRIWRRRASSARTVEGTSSSTKQTSSRFLLWACSASMSEVEDVVDHGPARIRDDSWTVIDRKLRWRRIEFGVQNQIGHSQ